MWLWRHGLPIDSCGGVGLENLVDFGLHLSCQFVYDLDAFEDFLELLKIACSD